MKILYYYPNYETFMFQWQKYHIFDEMQRHSVEFEIINPFSYSSIEEANAAIIKKIRTGQFHLFMSSFSTDNGLSRYIYHLYYSKRVFRSFLIFFGDTKASGIVYRR